MILTLNFAMENVRAEKNRNSDQQKQTKSVKPDKTSQFRPDKSVRQSAADEGTIK